MRDRKEVFYKLLFASDLELIYLTLRSFLESPYGI